MRPDSSVIIFKIEVIAEITQGSERKILHIEILSKEDSREISKFLFKRIFPLKIFSFDIIHALESQETEKFC